MDESILISVKKALGIDQEYADFDFDVMMNINSAIHTLYQVGYEPAKNFVVIGTDQTWEDLLWVESTGILSLVKMYIYAKVRLLFDPPTSSFVLTSLTEQTKELEWRIYAETEGGFDRDECCESCGKKEQESDGCGCGYDPWEGVPPNRDPHPGHHGKPHHKPKPPKPERPDGDSDEPWHWEIPNTFPPPPKRDSERIDIFETLRGSRNEMGRP